MPTHNKPKQPSNNTFSQSALLFDTEEKEATVTATTTTTPTLHQCQECDRSFRRKYSLNEHMKTHTGEKPFVCPIRACGKRFSTTGNLSRHRRLHGYIKPLECPVATCRCTFPSQHKLEKHMEVHFGLPVRICPVKGCGKTFSTTGNLNRHMKNQHATNNASTDLPADTSSVTNTPMGRATMVLEPPGPIAYLPVGAPVSAMASGGSDPDFLDALSCFLNEPAQEASGATTIPVPPTTTDSVPLDPPVSQAPASAGSEWFEKEELLDSVVSFHVSHLDE